MIYTELFFPTIIGFADANASLACAAGVAGVVLMLRTAHSAAADGLDRMTINAAAATARRHPTTIPTTAPPVRGGADPLEPDAAPPDVGDLIVVGRVASTFTEAAKSAAEE